MSTYESRGSGTRRKKNHLFRGYFLNYVVNSFIADKEASDAFVAASTILLRDAAPEHLKNESIDGDAAISVGPGKDSPPLRSEDVYYWQSFSRGICV